MLNAANEVAVEAFLAGGIAVPGDRGRERAPCSRRSRSTEAGGALRDLDDVLAADAWARARAREWLAAQRAAKEAARDALRPYVVARSCCCSRSSCSCTSSATSWSRARAACACSSSRSASARRSASAASGWPGSASGTDYVIAWFPLGGFVKMLGENPDEIDDPEVRGASGRVAAREDAPGRSSRSCSPGPAVNLILPVLVFAVTLAVGMPQRGRGGRQRRAGIARRRRGPPPGRPDHRDRGRAGHVVERSRARSVRARAGATRRRRATSAAARARPRPLAVARRTVADEFGKPIEVGWVGIEHHRPRRDARHRVVGRRPRTRRGLRSGDVVESRERRAPSRAGTSSPRPTPRRRAATVQLALRAASGRRARRPRGRPRSSRVAPHADRARARQRRSARRGARDRARVDA